MKIEELGLSARAYNVLKRAGIDTVEQLQRTSDDDLKRIRNMGIHTMKEIREKVAYVKTVTIADLIRASTDEELAIWIQNLINAGDTGFYCQQKKECQELLEQDKFIPERWCTKCMVAHLQKPAQKLPPRPNIFEDKQESGLIEED